MSAEAETPAGESAASGNAAAGTTVGGTAAAGTAQGRVYDLGYAPHEGPRLGRPAAIRAMILDGGRRALGLRRKAWTKALPWALIAAAIVPAAWVVALSFVASGFSLEDAGPFGDPAEFFEYIGLFTMFFLGLIGPTLLIPDREHGVLSIYASRPVRSADYLLARAVTLVGLGTLFMLIPHAIVYVGISALYVDGIWAGLLENAKQIPEILGTTAAFVFGYGAPAFLISLFARRLAIASGIYILVLFLSSMMVEAMPRVTELMVFKVIAPLSLFWNPYSVRDWLFDRESPVWPLDRVGFEPWVGAVAIAAIAIGTAVIAHRRYRSEF